MAAEYTMSLPIVLPPDLDLKCFLRCLQRLEIIGQLRYRFRQRSRSDFDNNRNRRGVLCALNNPAYTYPITSIPLEHLDTCRKGLRFLYSCTIRPYTWCIHPYHPEDRKLSEDDGQLTRPL